MTTYFSDAVKATRLQGPIKKTTINWKNTVISYSADKLPHACGVLLRPSSHAKLIQPTTQPIQTNPQPHPNSTLLRIIIVNIYKGASRRPALAARRFARRHAISSAVVVFAIERVVGGD